MSSLYIVLRGSVHEYDRFVLTCCHHERMCGNRTHKPFILLGGIFIPTYKNRTVDRNLLRCHLCTFSIHRFINSPAFLTLLYALFSVLFTVCCSSATSCRRSFNAYFPIFTHSFYPTKKAPRVGCFLSSKSFHTQHLCQYSSR